MNLQAHALHGLTISRQISEGILASFQNDDDWYYQAHPKANHALWIIGHLGLADNHFASMFREDENNKPAGYEELFWFGTEPGSDRSKYPPADEVLAYFRERREHLLKVLGEVSDEELMAPAPAENEKGPLAGAPSMGHAFQFAAFHEGIHTGQLSVCHRGLGHPPLFQPENATAEEGV